MIVYEDALCKVELPKKPAALGHLKVYPKKGKDLESLDDETVQHIFFVASYCATALFEGLGAQGTNIIMNNGKFANQDGELCIDVLSRSENDKMDILWKAKQGDPAKIEEIFKQLKGDAFYVGKETKKERTLEEPKPQKRKKITEENYLVKYLNKIP